MQYSSTDTIVALSSSPTHGVPARGLERAIVRLSGPRAFELAATVFTSETPANTDAAAWQRISGQLHWRGHQLPTDCYRMPGPRSYTRQDVTELHANAPRVAIEETISTLVKAGARAALPGEFTRRALLNGRIDLAQAEALGHLLKSESAAQARAFAARLTESTSHGKASVPGTSSSLASGLSHIREHLEDTLALLELGLDFSQEDVEIISRRELQARLETLSSEAIRLERMNPQSSAKTTGLRRSPEPRVVLCGPPNAGKSSLFNALLKREAALVSPEIHTTRDALEALFAPSPDVRVQLVDTAGFSSQDTSGTPAITEQAQYFAHTAARTADMLLLLFENQNDGERLIQELEALLNGAYPPVVGLIWTKSDQHQNANAPFSGLNQKIAPWGVKSRFEAVVSSKSGAGLEELKSYIRDHGLELSARVSAAWVAEESVLFSALLHVSESLQRARAVFDQNLGEDALAVELREALHALAETRGILLRHDALTESMLDRIFFQFCIGK